MPAHHVTDVFFGQFVVSQVDGLELVFVELGRDLAAFALSRRAQSQKHMGLVPVAHAVVGLKHALIKIVVFMYLIAKFSSEK